MRRLYIAALLTITFWIGSIPQAFAVPPVIDLPLDPNVDVIFTAGFGDAGHHDVGTPSEFAVDISAGGIQGKEIIAPFNGTVVYQRFANATLSRQRAVERGEVIPGSRATCGDEVTRDDDINSVNALWTLSVREEGGNTVITIFHVSEQTLWADNDQPDSIPLELNRQVPSEEFEVRRGDVIGRVGGSRRTDARPDRPDTPGSGCSSGPHIHMEVTSAGVLRAFQQSEEFEMNVRVGCPDNCEPQTLTVADLTQTSLFAQRFRAPIIEPPTETPPPDETPPPATEGAIDLFILVDLSSSFADDLSNFQVQARGIISTLRASNPDIRVGLARFEDYPIPPFGSAADGDKAYERLVDLTSDTDLVLDTISNLSVRAGVDGPESQLSALYQAATGAGQDLSGAGFSEASIPPGQQANFRDGATKLFLLWTDDTFHLPGDPGDIPYPGPSFSETVDAILALDPPKVIGISSGGGGLSDLQAIAEATDALAPPGGVDCDNNGAIDIPEGEPLVCGIAASGEGISAAIRATVEAATEPNVEELTITVQGNQPWTDTGIDLAAGSSVDITASGTIKISPADPGTTPAGDPDCIAQNGQQLDKNSENWLTPGLSCWSLVGRIGDGAPFQVGTNLSFPAETAGRLYLGVNDENGRFGNNSGSWTVEITVEAATSPNAAVTLPINDTTPGYYNNALGTILDGTQPEFPPADSLGDEDPTIFPASEPDLSAASDTKSM